jgi:putative glutamine amidotransferase
MKAPVSAPNRPLIGIPAWRRPAPPKDVIADGVSSSYIEALSAAGAVPLIVPLSADRDAQEVLFSLLDGLLLAGGEDIAPQHYGEPPSPHLGAIAAERDELELDWIQRAWVADLPMFCICRGIQVLNVALGGKLYQDIPSECERALRHHDGLTPPGWLEMRHRLIVEPDSQLAAWLGTCDLPVNSLHHQSIKTLAPGLRKVGQAEDGIVEAVEATDGKLALGIQCHPERLWQSDPRWAEVFRNFVRSCEKRKAERAERQVESERS